MDSEKISKEMSKTVKEAIDNAYLEGISSIMDELNQKYIIHVWREGSEKEMVADFKRWLELKNIEFSRLKRDGLSSEVAQQSQCVDNCVDQRYVGGLDLGDGESKLIYTTVKL